jgi:flavin reductase (DIM6/NTAB) family NADH-FMN oxidoreductase RutF
MNKLISVLDPVEALKGTFRRHASGVAVLTTTGPDGGPVGFTATSVTSLGANPPLISFNVARGASSWPAISTAKYVAMHTLGEENLAFARKMATDHTKRFADDDWTIGPYGLPIFDSVTSVLIVEVLQIVAIENNAVVISKVVEGLLGREQRALLYHERSYVVPGDILD